MEAVFFSRPHTWTKGHNIRKMLWLIELALPFVLPHYCAGSLAAWRFSWSPARPQSASKTPRHTWHQLSSLPTSSPPPGLGIPASRGHSHTGSGCLGCKQKWRRGQLQLQWWRTWMLLPCCLEGTQRNPSKFLFGEEITDWAFIVSFVSSEENTSDIYWLTGEAF